MDTSNGKMVFNVVTFVLTSFKMGSGVEGGSGLGGCRIHLVYFKFVKVYIWSGVDIDKTLNETQNTY